MSYHVAGESDESDNEFDYESTVICNEKHLQHDSDGNHQSYYEEDEQIQLNEEKEKKELEVLTACMAGNIDIVVEYLNLGHHINDYLHTGWTLLLYASSAVMPEVIEFLLSIDADPNKHIDGYTPIMAVCDSMEGTVEKTLKCISLLINAKANPNATSKDRRTALMYACKIKDPEIIAELLKYVNNIDICDKDGRSAIFYAVTGNKVETLKLLMKNKASVSIVDRRGLTIKDIAATKNFEKILQILEFDNEEIDRFCPIREIRNWKDALSSINHTDPNTIDPEIANILFAVNLEKHRQLFKGMNIKTFLQLTAENIIKMGIELEHERHMLLNGLRKFHSAKWKPQSIRVAKKCSSSSLFDGIAVIANVTRQLAVIGATFGYIRKHLLTDDGSGIILDDNEREMIHKEFEETEKIFSLLKKDLHKTLKFAKKVQNNSKTMLPPSYIGPKISKKKINWTIFVTLTVVAGIFISRSNIQDSISSIMRKLWR